MDKKNTNNNNRMLFYDKHTGKQAENILGTNKRKHDIKCLRNKSLLSD